MLPNVFLVGAARAGTTSLWRYLSRQPRVFFPRLKEPKFFSADDNTFPHEGPGDRAVDANVVRDWTAYQRLFDESMGAAVAGDASVDSLYFPGAPRRIDERCPGARVLITLRDPVDRAFSSYKYLVLSGRETLPFDQALEREPDRRRANWEFIWHYRRVGCYAAQVERYLQVFGRDRVHVIDFGDLVGRPVAALTPVLRPLGLEPPVPDEPFEHACRSTIPASPLLRSLVVRGTRVQALAERLFPARYDQARAGIQRHCRRELTLADDARRHLQRAFAADRRDLEDLLGRRLGWWKDAAS